MNYVNCLLSNHVIHNGYLILLIDAYLDDYHEWMLIEKSIFIGSEEFYDLLAGLKIGFISEYEDFDKLDKVFDKLDGFGILAEIIRSNSGTHAIGKIILDMEYLENCQNICSIERFYRYITQNERQGKWVIKENRN